MDEVHKMGLIVVPITWLIGIIVSLTFYFALSKNINLIWTKSYVLGLATGLMNFGLTFKGGKSFLKEIAKPDGAGSPVKSTMISYFLRILVAGAVFVAVLVNQNSSNPKLDIIPTLIGFCTFKAVLIVVMIIRKGKVSE